MDDGGGTACATRLSHLMDEVIRALYDFAATQVYRSASPSRRAHGGGGGRRLRPRHAGAGLRHRSAVPAALQADAWGEQIVEYMLYMLWDLGLKVGHATRTIDECMRLARADITIRTVDPGGALPVGRRGAVRRADAALRQRSGEGHRRRIRRRPSSPSATSATRQAGERATWSSPTSRTARAACATCRRCSGSASTSTACAAARSWSSKGVFTPRGIRPLPEAEDFLWAVRCHLHFLTGRAEERLTFDIQPEIAERLGYTGHPGLRRSSAS